VGYSADSAGSYNRADGQQCVQPDQLRAVSILSSDRPAIVSSPAAGMSARGHLLGVSAATTS
jgi:hypothetical protein